MKTTRSVVIEDELWEKLQELAEKRYTSVSAIIRQSIAKEIKRVEKKAVTN